VRAQCWRRWKKLKKQNDKEALDSYQKVIAIRKVPERARLSACRALTHAPAPPRQQTMVRNFVGRKKERPKLTPEDLAEMPCVQAEVGWLAAAMGLCKPQAAAAAVAVVIGCFSQIEKSQIQMPTPRHTVPPMSVLIQPAMTYQMAPTLVVSAAPARNQPLCARSKPERRPRCSSRHASAGEGSQTRSSVSCAACLKNGCLRVW
jgi:hypothetical protein